MGLDDLFKHRGHGHHRDHGYYRGHHDSHHGHIDQYIYLFNKVRNNRKLLVALAVAAAIMVVVAVSVVVAVMPFLLKGAETVQESGVKGLIEATIPFVERLWTGSGK